MHAGHVYTIVTVASTVVVIRSDHSRRHNHTYRHTACSLYRRNYRYRIGRHWYTHHTVVIAVAILVQGRILKQASHQHGGQW